MLAKDIMHKRVISVGPSMTLKELAKLLSDRGITGAPVVSPDGKVLGVVSQTDLVREKGEVVSVEQVMTPWAVSFEEDTPVRELARQMVAKHIHRIIITKDGELCGIVTSMDLLRVLVGVLGAEGG